MTKFLHSPNRQIDPEMLQRAIRAHGNLIEYAPLFLILLLLCEFSNLNSLYLHVAGIFFFLGRLMHGIGFGFMLHSPILRIEGLGSMENKCVRVSDHSRANIVPEFMKGFLKD